MKCILSFFMYIYFIACAVVFFAGVQRMDAAYMIFSFIGFFVGLDAYIRDVKGKE